MNAYALHQRTYRRRSGKGAARFNTKAMAADAALSLSPENQERKVFADLPEMPVASDTEQAP